MPAEELETLADFVLQEILMPSANAAPPYRPTGSLPKLPETYDRSEHLASAQPNINGPRTGSRGACFLLPARLHCHSDYQRNGQMISLVAHNLVLLILQQPSRPPNSQVKA